MNAQPASSAPTGRNALPVPNHHATHPGFSGASGFVAAVSFLFGRDHAAQLAIELSDLRPGDRLVDVGCGPGIAVRRARAIGAEAIGVDPAPVMLRVGRARWRAASGIDWRIGTAESLPVDDGWANVVWSLSTVHHWADVNAALAEARRVLAPGGRLVALERRIHDTNAAGTASHGWTVEQSESFAEHCRRDGFADVTVAAHAGRSTILSVVAHLPESEQAAQQTGLDRRHRECGATVAPSPERRDEAHAEPTSGSPGRRLPHDVDDHADALNSHSSAHGLRRCGEPFAPTASYASAG